MRTPQHVDEGTTLEYLSDTCVVSAVSNPPQLMAKPPSFSFIAIEMFLVFWIMHSH